MSNTHGDAQDSPQKYSSVSARLRRVSVNPVVCWTLLVLLGAGTGLLSLLLGAGSFGLPMFRAYFASPVLILLNLLVPVVLILLMYFISGRAWIAFTVPSLLILTLTAIAFFKQQIRGDPLLLSDLFLAGEAKDIVSAYTLTLNWKLFFVFAAFICCAAFSAFALRHKVRGIRTRLIGISAVIAASVGLYALVYTSTAIYDTIKSSYETHEWSFAENYISRGFIYPFIHNGRRAMLSKPEGYSKSAAEAIAGEYENGEIAPGDELNIISIMLESYADLSTLYNFDFALDVYAPLRRLQEESVSGNLVVNTFGGGTIDTERLFLTGYTILPTITSPVNSFVHYLKGQGYYTEGMHAGDKWFYDRDSVNKYLGFDNYYFLEDYGHENRSDEFFFGEVMRLYRSRDTGTPYFSYNLSYQNHGAYDTESTGEPFCINQAGMSDEAYNIVNNYLRGIYDTTLRIETFVNELRLDPQPVVVVLFGDHMPWLGNNDSVYHELGINISQGTQEGIYNFYSVPYVIWANDAAKELTNSDFTGSGNKLSACFLMSEVFDLCNFKGDWYMQALREFRQYAGVISNPTGMFRENDTLTDELSYEAKMAHDRLKLLEYYRIRNFTY